MAGWHSRRTVVHGNGKYQEEQEQNERKGRTKDSVPYILGRPLTLEWV